MKITFAYDGSDCAEEALQDIGRAGFPDDAEMMILTVSEWFPILPEVHEGEEEQGADADPAPAQSEQQMALIQAEMAREMLHEEHPGWNISTESRGGSPAHEIIRGSEEWNSDLIVVGSHGRSALGRLLLGSVSHQVATSAHSSVRIARSGYAGRETGRPVRILLAIDGSNYSEGIIEQIEERRWEEGTEALVVSGIECTYNHDEEVINLSELQELHRGIIERLEKVGVIGQSMIDTKLTQPRRLILEEAHRSGADTIFMGARGLTGFERFMLGSVSTAVAMQAECSVEIVRR